MQPFDIIYIISYGIMIYCSILWLTVYFSSKKDIHKNTEPDYYPRITILVPAYNEEKYINNCLDSLINQDYPEDKLNIIVINDGSEDKTPDIAQKYAHKYENVTLINKENTGKGSSLNYGLKMVTTPIVGCMDADSYPDKDYLKNMVACFEHKNMTAVTPSIKIIKTDSWVQKLQWVEYIFQIFLRKIFALFDIQYVIPGPGGLYRTQFLKNTGMFDEESITEDMEIAFRVHDHEKKIENSVDAKVYTQAPKSLKALFGQRIRWYRGYMQTVKKYSHFLFNKKYGNLGLFLLPISIVFICIIIFFLFIPIYYNITGIIDYIDTILLVGFKFNMPTLTFDIISLSYHIIFLTFFLIMTFFSIWLSLKMADENIEIRKRILHYTLFLVLYLPLFTCFWITSIIEEIRGVKRKW